MKTLSLTTPLTRGTNVLLVQRTLQQNPWGADYLRAQPDGVFGPATGRACIRAKYHLGYPQRLLQPTYGDTLHALLTKQRALPPLYRARRLARLRPPAKPMREKALEWLTRRLGDKESPAGSNRVTWASLWYGIVGPWCAMGVTRAYVEAGSKAFTRGSRYAYVPFIVHDARHGANGLQITTEPQPGDLVCFDWTSDGTADHIGLFEKWTNRRAGAFQSIECNTALGNDSNGGQVMRRDRLVGQVQAFVRVGR
jgi:hypothetical protein